MQKKSIGRIAAAVTLAAAIVVTLRPTANAAGNPEGKRQLSMDEAVSTFDKNGFDLLIADAQIAAARADKLGLEAVPNPAFNANVNRAFNYDPNALGDDGKPLCTGGGCSAWGFGVGITDNAALMQLLVGKRVLRRSVADAAIMAAKMSKEDARRTLQNQVKAAYIEIARAQAGLELAKQTAESAAKTLLLNDKRYDAGAIDQGELARVDTAKLQADVAVDQADVAVQTAKVALMFLLGQRGGSAPPPTDFDVDATMIKFNVPPRIAAATLESLMREAREHRPDLKLALAQKEHARAGIDLAKRERVPDISLGLQYSQTGTGQSAIQPPSLSLGVTVPLPIFYQNQGDIAKAQADLYQQSTQEQKTLAQIDTDVRSAWASYETLRRIVERYETGGLLDRAKQANDITRIQFERGKAPLMDFLDAQRTFIAVNTDYLTQAAQYWDAIFTLEQAVGEDLRH